MRGAGEMGHGEGAHGYPTPQEIDETKFVREAYNHAMAKVSAAAPEALTEEHVRMEFPTPGEPSRARALPALFSSCPSSSVSALPPLPHGLYGAPSIRLLSLVPSLFFWQSGAHPRLFLPSLFAVVVARRSRLRLHRHLGI